MFTSGPLLHKNGLWALLVWFGLDVIEGGSGEGGEYVAVRLEEVTSWFSLSLQLRREEPRIMPIPKDSWSLCRDRGHTPTGQLVLHCVSASTWTELLM